MIDLPAVLAGAGVCLAGVVSPGPNFLAVSHRASSSARKEAVAMALGIALVNALWAVLALFGLGLVTGGLPWVLALLQIAGSAYLVGIGGRMLRHAGRRHGLRGGEPPAGGVRRALIDGISTNLVNPKSMMFYVSVFAAAVPKGAAVSTLLALVLAVAMVALGWYGMLALALSTPHVAKRFGCHQSTIERTCGVLLVLLGIRQAFAA